MKKIILSLSIILSLGSQALAESPIIITKADFNRYDLLSEVALDTWFTLHTKPSEGGYIEGACELLAPPYRVVNITNHAYAGKGVYGIAIDDGNEGFERITFARLEWFKNGNLFLEIEDGRQILCQR